MTAFVKICGLRSPDAMEAALAAGADAVGLVRYSRSPRHVGLNDGRDLATLAQGRAACVLLLVDPNDRELDEAVAAISPDAVQLHGSETPDRVAAIRARTGLPVWKAIGIASARDLDWLLAYRGAADRLLLDAKPGASDLPGGNGAAFDWRLLAGRDLGDAVLSGGLSLQNVGTAIRVTGARAVDVSSGVESRPGEKDPAKIEAFIRNARAAFDSAMRREVA